MSRGRLPRHQRRVNVDTFNLARARGQKLSPAAQADVMMPLRAAITSLRRGVATEFEWAVAVTAVNIADAIESIGVVRGMAGHLQEIDLALHGICARAMSTGEWCPTALYYQELDLLDLLVDLHGHQLARLSVGEFARARDKAIQQTRSAGGVAISLAASTGVTA